MQTGHYAPWEHYPKTLRQYEIENPLSVVADFFSTDSVKGHSKTLKEWRHYVVNDKHYDDGRHGPGSLLFNYDLNLKILEAMYLLLLDYKNFSYRQEKLTEAKLVEEKEQWAYFPKNLSLKEQLDPFKAVKKVFKKTKPQHYRDYLHEWAHAALYNKADNESLYAGEIITVYENLLKLYSAAWLIYQRNNGKKAYKKIEDGGNQAELNNTPVELRTINPNPTAAEKLALEELKALILKRCPSVQIIVHLGTHPDPFTFFLLILIGDEEKTPEHEVGNKIEDNCRHLADVHAIVHKSNSAKEGINIGRRFWSTVMEKGYILYRAPELVLPDHQEITKEILLERAKFNWERWGTQAKEFLKGAAFYRANKNYRLDVFLLHQSVESALKAIIQVILGYRVQMHNLSRLLRLTLLFTDVLKEVFELNTTEGSQLYQLLQSAYSQSRYKSTFDPDGKSVTELANIIKKFIDLAERIYKQFVEDTKETG
jgi:HEPN domain-containing protein